MRCEEVLLLLLLLLLLHRRVRRSLAPPFFSPPLGRSPELNRGRGRLNVFVFELRRRAVRILFLTFFARRSGDFSFLFPSFRQIPPIAVVFPYPANSRHLARATETGGGEESSK